MSLFGAMQSGISGMAAQSNAMGAISDNISNVNTVGYKGTNVSFQTLVTKQTSSNFYSPGGVQPVSKQGVDVQGLLSSTSSSTALAVSGSGYFVVNQAPNPQEGDAWAYTRAGDFSIDTTGYLKNTGGFYAQGWSLLPWDGTPTASTVEIGGVMYMKAYYASDGSTVYINDNIVDNNNLKPINLATIGGTATPTQQVSFGANLPADDPIYDPTSPEAGGYRSISALIYDSLGNSSNLSINFIKESTNSWGMGVDMPSGAANLILTGNKEVSDGGTADVYYAAGQLEFKTIPANGASITITDQSTGKNYIFDFLNTATAAPAGDADNIHIKVDIEDGITSVTDFINAFNNAIQANMPGADRFSTTSNSIQIVQSQAGAALTIDASKTQACLQSAANPVLATGIPTGIFEIPEIDQDIKNTARFDFTSTTLGDYTNQTIDINGTTFTFVANAPANTTQIDLSQATVGGQIDTVKLVSLIEAAIQANIAEPERFVASGSSLEIMPSATGGDITVNMNNLAGVMSVLAYLGLDWRKALSYLPSFEPLPHRLQKVGVVDGVLFINDSISTAPEAAIGGMKSFADNMAIISGGIENKQDYTEYAKFIEANPKVKAAITLFQCGHQIAESIRKYVKRSDFTLIEASNLQEAVNKAYDEMKKTNGTLVLFSPTAPSFGYYKNFIERGEDFINCVKTLAKSKKL